MLLRPATQQSPDLILLHIVESPVQSRAEYSRRERERWAVTKSGEMRRRRRNERRGMRGKSMMVSLVWVGRQNGWF
jgi:hypothetical protein